MSLSLPTRPALPTASRSDTAPVDTAPVDTVDLDTVELDTVDLDTVELDTVEVDPAEADTVLLPAPRPASDPLPGTARPVFVDATGRRLRRLRRVGALVGVACVGYLVVLAAAVGGGVVDPVTSGLPLSGAVAPLVDEPTTTTTRPTTTTRSTPRSTAVTTRAATPRTTAAVAPAPTAAPATAPTTAAPATTSAPAPGTTATSASATSSAPATSETATETPEAADDSGDTAQGSETS